MKKFVELQLATKPRGSSISASSAPALIAWISAWMRLSRLCELSRRSKTSGPLVRNVEVKSDSPLDLDSGRGVLYSATMANVALPITKRGSWLGVLFMPRETIRRIWAPSSMPFAASVSLIAALISSRLRPMSSAIDPAPSKSRSRCASSWMIRPRLRRSPSHTPSPSTKPLSNTDTMARSRGTSWPSM